MKLEKVLLNAIDIEKLVYKHPELFNFSTLTTSDKITLLTSNLKFFSDKINMTALSPIEKGTMIVQGTKALASKITISDEELEKIPNALYAELVIRQFSRFIRKDRFEKLPKSSQQEIFLKNPEWVLENIDKPPKLTSARLTSLARSNPSFVAAHVTDFSQVTTTDYFWREMFSYDLKFKEVFIKNTKSLITKTEVRSIIWNYPDIIKLIDADTFSNSKLTGKEWIMLIGSVMDHKRSKDIFKDWKFSDDVAEVIKLDLTAEFISGKSAISQRFKNAMSGIFKVADEV